MLFHGTKVNIFLVKHKIVRKNSMLWLSMKLTVLMLVSFLLLCIFCLFVSIKVNIIVEKRKKWSGNFLQSITSKIMK